MVSDNTYGSVRLITSRFGTNVRRENKFTIDDHTNQRLPPRGQRPRQQGAPSAITHRPGRNPKGTRTRARHPNEFRNKPGERHPPRIPHDPNGATRRSHKPAGGHTPAQPTTPGPSPTAPGAWAATKANSSETTRQLGTNITRGSHPTPAQFFWSLLRRATAHKVPIFAT